jgi:hypothetical protein
MPEGKIIHLFIVKRDLQLNKRTYKLYNINKSGRKLKILFQIINFFLETKIPSRTNLNKIFIVIEKYE